jgi:group I intron endonuclease
MSSKQKCGVYVIEQIGIDRYYIGSSKAIRNRWYVHRRLLRRGEHHSVFLQNAWNKHGEDSFSFRILEECKPEELESREQQYIDSFSPVFNAVMKIKSRTLRPEILEKRNASVRAYHEKITHCPHGHPYDMENTYRNKKGDRICRECNAERVSRIYASETPEQREVRRQKVKASYEANKTERIAKMREYMASRKDQKREYDRLRHERLKA